ncbi:MAG: protein kinase [candidate division Zixibacteria bacterium]|nr:protein kinase [candidate division Zixibacteria bacterium]
MEPDDDRTQTHVILTKGTMVAHYRIIEKIGAGGMGEVYLAEDTKLKRQVALKFLPPHLCQDDDCRERFKREAQAAAKLNHTNIVHIYEVADFQGRPFFAMEHIEGQSLKDMIKTEELSLKRIFDLSIQICEGLAEAHEKEVVHRDIKPSNIVLDTKGRPRLLDFGLAVVRGKDPLTRPGSTIGTVQYMSPEQAEGKEVDHRSDLFSFGVVLYEMITGHGPFESDNEAATLHAITHITPPQLARYRSDATDALQAIIDKALERDPAIRYQTAAGLISDLKRIARGTKAHVVATAPKPSIAVLPFVNLSADPEQEYFCDGMAEEIINALTHIDDLRVIARTSAFAFKGKQEDVREIGRKLDVETLLEGSVRKAGNRLRITTQLVKVADGSHIWSERYDREMEDVFAIQDDIAQAVVDKMRVKLVRKSGEPVVRKHTDNLEAYSLFLKGRHHLYQFTAEGWKKSLECLNRAIELDPDYAMPYVWKAIAYQSQVFWGGMAPDEAFANSTAAIEKALQLDDSIADAYNLQAVTSFSHDWDWDKAERTFKRALELAPTVALIHTNYSLFLMVLKRYDQALEEADIARKLDPLSSMVNTWAAIVPLFAGQVQDSIDQLKAIIKTDPDYWQPNYHMSVALREIGRMDEAIASAKRAFELSGGAPITLTQIICCYYLNGDVIEAEKSYDELVQLAQKLYVPPMFFAWISFVRNDLEEGIAWLDKAEQTHDYWLCWAASSSFIDREADPRIDALIKRIGLT